MTGGLPRDPTPVDRNNEDDLGVSGCKRFGRAYGPPNCEPLPRPQRPGESQKKEEKEEKDQIQSERPVQLHVRGYIRWDGECLARHASVPQTHPQATPFRFVSGTGSTAEAFKEQGFEVITLDFNAKYRPDILVDILDWDYEKAFSPGYFHTIANSPLHRIQRSNDIQAQGIGQGLCHC